VTLPDPHPNPPIDFNTRKLPLAVVNRSWIRSHHQRFAPIHFGTSGLNRFDAPASEFGVLYVAADPHGAFIETFGRRLGETRVELVHVASRTLSQVDQTRPLHLVDITGAGLPQMGADARLGTGDYRLSRRWSLALYEHPEQPDGILYRSRHDPSRICAAIFGRAADALTATSLGSLADARNVALLATLLDAYGYSLIFP
jgi:hypothetical protein